MVDKEYKESIIGTPQGGNLSPLLSNIILNELDKNLKQEDCALHDTLMTASFGRTVKQPIELCS